MNGYWAGTSILLDLNKIHRTVQCINSNITLVGLGRNRKGIQEAIFDWSDHVRW